MKDSELDVYIDRETPAFPVHNSSFGNSNLLHDLSFVTQPRHDFQEEIPIKAVKLGLRLSSNLRKSTESHNHVLCKAKHTSTESLEAKNTLNIIEAAKKELRNSRYYRAAMLVEREISRGVRHADLLYLAGEARRNMNHYNLAEDHLLEAMSMQVYNPYCLYSLALVYSMQEKYDKAIPVLVDFIDMIEDKEAYYELAKCYVCMKNYSDAIVQFSRYLDLCGDVKSVIPCLIQRAEAYEKISRPDLAVLDYRMVRQLDPQFHEPYIDYAESLEKEGLFPQANKIRKFVSKLFI